MVDGAGSTTGSYDEGARLNIVKPTKKNIELAAKIVSEAGVVVMPTETVYGLACDAMNDAAVQRVFAIKGRPSDNPLIVHIAKFEDLHHVAQDIPEVAVKLAERFWPGPLTMVLPKRPEVPYRTTAGLDTVAVRVPNHDVALSLIQESGCFLAAPSANLFTRISPTQAEDVDRAITEQVGMILDGGPCDVGLESTVLDLSSDEPRILRPGLVTRSDIQAVLGKSLGETPSDTVRRSPGLYRRHYAPRAKVNLVNTLRPGQPGMTFNEPSDQAQFRMPLDPRAYAAILYGVLKRLDDMQFDEIGVELPPVTPEWEAIHDRLRKASAT